MGGDIGINSFIYFGYLILTSVFSFPELPSLMERAVSKCVYVGPSLGGRTLLHVRLRNALLFT
jgi:hypothetical protein